MYGTEIWLYDRDYLDERGDNDNNDGRRGGLFEMAGGEGTTMIAIASTATSWMEAGGGGGGNEGVEDKEVGRGV